MAVVENMWRQLAEIRLHRAICAALEPAQRIDMQAWQAAARRATCLCPVCGQNVSGGLAGYDQHRRQSTRCRRTKASILRHLGRASGVASAAPVTATACGLSLQPLAVEVVSAALASGLDARGPVRTAPARLSMRAGGPTLVPVGGEVTPYSLLCRTRAPHMPLKVKPMRHVI